MSQRIATVRLGQPAPDPSTALEGLGRGWLILGNCRLGSPRGRGLPSALLHPAAGVVLLDILPAESPGAVEAFRARLAAARFQAIFPGHLPVVHLRLAPRQLDELRPRLEHAFAAQPPLSLPGGDAWMTAVARALTTEPPVPRLRSRRIRRHSRRRASAFRRLAGAAALATGLLAVAYAYTTIRQPHALSAESPATIDAALIPATQSTAMPPPSVTAAAGDPPMSEPAALPEAPEPATSAQPPALSATQKIAARPAPKPPPPDRPNSNHATHTGLAATASPPPIPVPRPESGARHLASEFPQPKEDPPAKMAVPLHAPPDTAPEPARLPPIAARVLPPIAAPVAAHPPEPPLQHCHRIVYLVGQGVLLPEEELQFFQQSCVRR